MKMPWLVAVLALGLGASVGLAQTGGETTSAVEGTFTNPVLERGPDPWVVYWKGFYYYSNSEGSDLVLRKTADITDLRHAEVKTVWTPEPGHAWSKEVWAPELHRWGKKWYIYFAADAGENAGHRIFVVENDSDDPMAGEWTLLGKVGDATDRWAIDATTFELRGQHYLVWSGWKGTVDGEQDLFIAHMKDPHTIDSPRTLISQPTYDWEMHGDLSGRHVNVNEGPEFLAHGTKMFIVYSASGCWTDFYSLGAIEADSHADPLDAKSWTKIDHPLLSTDAAAHAYSPGHNGFFKSPNGKQDWIIYHANPEPGQGCGDVRSPRIQRFTWGKDGVPDFGKPVALEERLDKPAQ
jgi:GH43 family beta-xylosidase